MNKKKNEKQEVEQEEPITKRVKRIPFLKTLHIYPRFMAEANFEDKLG